MRAPLAAAVLAAAGLLAACGSATVEQETPTSIAPLETAALSDAAIEGACRAAEAAGADFVKTSTGFHPAGGASVHAIEIMQATVGGRLGIKASGGIRTAADALAMVNAGATRLGLSASKKILTEFAAQDAQEA